MARDTATQWIIGLAIYFIVITLFMTGVGEFADDFDLTTSVTSTGGGTDYLNSGVSECGSPRLDKEYTPACSYLLEIGSINDNDTCSDYSGCEWKEKKIFLFWGTDDFTCSGDINSTAYNNGTLYSNFTAIRKWTKPVCGLSNLSDSQSLCEAFGCTWFGTGNLPELDNYKKAPKTIWKFISNIITFRVNFYTGLIPINVLLNFLLIWVPLLIMMFSFYILIR